MNKEIIVYIDLDDTLCDYKGAFIKKVKENPLIQYPQSTYGFFLDLEPLPGAIESFNELSSLFSVYIASRPSYLNPMCYTEKRVWVEKHLGLEACKKMFLAPEKKLLIGNYLIDDVIHEGFKGEQIQFGSEKFPDWNYVLKYLKNEI